MSTPAIRWRRRYGVHARPRPAGARSRGQAFRRRSGRRHHIGNRPRDKDAAHPPRSRPAFCTHACQGGTKPAPRAYTPTRSRAAAMQPKRAGRRPAAGTGRRASLSSRRQHRAGPLTRRHRRRRLVVAAGPRLDVCVRTSCLEAPLVLGNVDSRPWLLPPFL
jgi:hypothetical protein